MIIDVEVPDPTFERVREFLLLDGWEVVGEEQSDRVHFVRPDRGGNIILSIDSYPITWMRSIAIAYLSGWQIIYHRIMGIAADNAPTLDEVNRAMRRLSGIPYEHEEAMRKLIASGTKVQAIKYHREVFGSSLYEAKNYVDGLISKMGIGL